MPNNGNLNEIIKALGPLLSGRSDYAGLEATGIKPKRKPTYRRPPDYFRKEIVGLDSGNATQYTTLKFWVQKPNRDFPKTALKLSFGNANHYLFTTTSTEELGKLMSFFENAYKIGCELTEHYKSLEEEMLKLREKMDEMENNAFEQYSPEIAKVLEGVSDDDI